jgi:hypothetical protein
MPNVDDIMAGRFAVRQPKTILARSCDALSLSFSRGVLVSERYRENSDGKIVKNVSKPSGEFNVCMGGDDGRYGWLGVAKGTERPPPSSPSLFAV